MTIVYNSFGGRYSDSPRALYEALVRDGDHDHVWLADPAHLDGFPAGVRTVLFGSQECVDALESAELLIANTHTEVEWRKSRGATYLQTWHGTPLKRIHWDVLWAPEGRLPRLQRDVDRWDCLLSPNRVTTPRLRGAFRYEGEVLETGYPRNDALSAPDRDEARARVRTQLGIAPGQTAVLYTPTWRDDVVFGGRDTEPIELELDVDAVTRRLGDDHVLLLRLHYMLTGRLAALAHPAVRDVSFHPDIRELYLAADVLVTDYSSTMFDFAITGRPIVFFAYDLDDFRDRQRGFYFDFVPEAPGPLVETSSELADVLADLPAATRPFAERYERFRATYCEFEDGRATERVLERLAERVPLLTR